MGLSELHPVTPQSNGNAARQPIKAIMVGVLPLFSDVLVIINLILDVLLTIILAVSASARQFQPAPPALFLVVLPVLLFPLAIH
jgi:hypothetical protein